MRRYWCIPLVTAALVAGCKSGEGQTDATAKVSASAQNTAAEASAHASSVKEKPKAASLVGSSIARTPTGDALYVADEDRGVVLRVALPVDVTNTPAKITMPGQPAEVGEMAGARWPSERCSAPVAKS